MKTDPERRKILPCPICAIWEEYTNPCIFMLGRADLDHQIDPRETSFRITLFGHCPTHGEVSIAASSNAGATYHDFVAYEAEKKSLIRQICGRLTKLIEELSR